MTSDSMTVCFVDGHPHLIDENGVEVELLDPICEDSSLQYFFGGFEMAEPIADLGETSCKLMIRLCECASLESYKVGLPADSSEALSRLYRGPSIADETEHGIEEATRRLGVVELWANDVTPLDRPTSSGPIPDGAPF